MTKVMAQCALGENSRVSPAAVSQSDGLSSAAAGDSGLTLSGRRFKSSP